MTVTTIDGARLAALAERVAYEAMRMGVDDAIGAQVTVQAAAAFHGVFKAPSEARRKAEEDAYVTMMLRAVGLMVAVMLERAGEDGAALMLLPDGQAAVVGA
jgi:hypothetical protein